MSKLMKLVAVTMMLGALVAIVGSVPVEAGVRVGTVPVEATPKGVLETVNARLAGTFVGADGLILDYIGDSPTAAEISENKPNAMGWWCPIENGSMFTGEWLPALMAEGVFAKPLVERCVQGLLKMSEVSEVPGFIARGTGTDGKSHYPCGSNDQTDPWFLGLGEYCRWQHATPALRRAAIVRMTEVAKALEANGWNVPCDGTFAGENRGQLNGGKMPFCALPRFLYALKSLEYLTGDAHWGKIYVETKAQWLPTIEMGAEIDAKAFPQCYSKCVWIYVASAQALARLAEMEELPADAARFRAGLKRYAAKVAPRMKDRAKYDNAVTERPFKYANWRTGYAWRPQKTQQEAETVAWSGRPEILGTRKAYEREGMSIPLAAAAVCALTGEAQYRDEILATLRHYDYATCNLSEFFHGAIAAAALVRQDESPRGATSRAIAAGYAGKTAVLTGAASGMGRCCAETLAEGGATVFVCDINAAGAKRVADAINARGKGRAYAVACDVRTYADAEKAAALALEKTGRIDLMVHWAGGYEPRMRNTNGVPFYEQPIEVLDWGIDVNLKGAIYFARACMPQMVKQRSGVIVCIGSVTGFEGDGCGAMYGTSKSGLYNFVKGLAKAGAPHGIRAFSVTPGPVMTRPGMANMKTVLDRPSQPQELVDFVLYMASDSCPSVTGTNHVMDAGRLCLP